MNESVSLIQTYAKQLKKFEQSDVDLFEHLNSLPVAEIDKLIADLDFVKTDFTSFFFQPVNLLRLEILRKIKEGIPVNSDLIEEIKNKIIAKDEPYFTSYGDKFIQALRSYPVKKKHPFVNWQRNFGICFPFLYSDAEARETKNALSLIAAKVMSDLNLAQYESHIVDFNGPQNYGTSSCWIACFPKNKVSHRKAYQLFFQIHAEKITAGILAGSDINDKSANNLVDCFTLDEVIVKLRISKNKTEQKNNALINYWKYAPGESGIYWDEFFNEGIIAIGWDKLNDLTTYKTDDLAKALGVEDPENSNEIWNIENFEDASIGDIVIANRGKSKALGIGILTGVYEFKPDRSYFKHTRKVKWLINHLVEFDKTIFRPDTFTPTLKWQSIKEKYIEADAAFEKIFNDLDAGKEVLPPPKALPNDSETQNYWWLNANPKIWSIASYELGDIQTYTSHNDKNNKRRIYKYFQEVKPGDLVIGYESTPVKQIKAIFEITESLHLDDIEGEIISFEIKEIVKAPLTWDELKENKGLENCEVFKNNQGSLFSLNEEEFEIIRDLIDDKNIVIEKETKEIIIKEYSIFDDSEKPFFDRKEIDEIIQSIEVKKNIVLQGPPGVGKTFVAEKLAFEMMKTTDKNRIKMVQFHQSYAYEDFIQGIRPSGNAFKVKPGIFFEFCKKAEQDKNNKFFFIIDEINRGNLSKIFGELMMLIESDKRGKYQVPLTYSDKDDVPFSVPDNLYIIGTMNTADRSLAIVDYALRRRFRFISLQPKFNVLFTSFLKAKGVSDPLIQKITNRINVLNATIKADKNLGEGFLIGHSYFCNSFTTDEDEWYRGIVKYEIAPLLEEYWFDDLEKAKKEVELLLA